MFKDRLKEIGFNDNEAKFYMELLRVGPQAVSILAKRLAVNRSSAYSILDSLEKKGIVSSYRHSNVKYYIANDPNCLIGYLDRKRRTFFYFKTQFLALIPRFRRIMDSYEFKRPIVSYFEGLEGIKHVISDVLDSNEPVFSFLNVRNWTESKLNKYIFKYKEFSFSQFKSHIKIIVTGLNENGYRNFLEKHDFIDFLNIELDSSLDLFENEMVIYGDKLAIVRVARGEEYGVIIKSREIANMHRAMFDVTWERFKNIVK